MGNFWVMDMDMNSARAAAPFFSPEAMGGGGGGGPPTSTNNRYVRAQYRGHPGYPRMTIEMSPGGAGTGRVFNYSEKAPLVFIQWSNASLD